MRYKDVTVDEIRTAFKDCGEVRLSYLSLPAVPPHHLQVVCVHEFTDEVGNRKNSALVEFTSMEGEYVN